MTTSFDQMLERNPIRQKKLLEDTERRYSERSSVRNRTKELLKEGRILETDSRERVEKRLNRLGISPRALGLREAEMNLTLERVLGRSDLMTFHYLGKGAAVGRTIGRIHIRDGNFSAGFGTGFMVSPHLIMTNNHVLSSAAEAAPSLVEFNYEEDFQGTPLPVEVFELDPSEFFITHEDLDYTLTALKPVSRNGKNLSDFGYTKLIESIGKIINGEYVSIIQHPNGERKKVALRENRIVDLLPDFLHYETDTAPGSSGSPVFNDQWEVVALHHSGVPKTDENGNYLTIDGRIWTSGMDPNLLAWRANEGVRISRIVNDVRQRPLSGRQADLRTELLANSPAPPTETQPGTVPYGTLPQQTPGGAAVWTIPLIVSVQLGSGAAITQTPPSPAPTPVRTQAPPEPVDDDVERAIAETRRSRSKKYYDEELDHTDRRQYYASIDPNTSPQHLYRALSRLVQDTHRTEIKYKPMLHVYPWVDLHPDLKIRSVYSGRSFEPEELIRSDFAVERERIQRLQEIAWRESSPEKVAMELDLLESALPYNCEHVVPQSWFNKKEPMRGDLHHLFACESRCNSFRSNTPYFDFPDFEETVRDDCGKREELRFEPSSGKGAAARAVLYFTLRYPGEINRTEREYQAERLDVLIDWVKTDPPARYELHRNQAIFQKQGNRNPLIDHPDWLDRIDFTQGLG